MNKSDNTIDEKIVVGLLKAGSQQAFNVLYDRYKYKLFTFGLKFLKSAQLTEELIHDVFLKVWQNKSKINVDYSFGSFLFTISRNLIINYIKKSSREVRILEEMHYYSRVMCSNNDEETDILEKEVIAAKIINSLPPQRKIVFTMCKVEGKSYDEVSSILGISRNAVKDHIVKAGKAIKECIHLHSEIISLLILSNLLNN